MKYGLSDEDYLKIKNKYIKLFVDLKEKFETI